MINNSSGVKVNLASHSGFKYSGKIVFILPLLINKKPIKAIPIIFPKKHIPHYGNTSLNLILPSYTGIIIVKQLPVNNSAPKKTMATSPIPNVEATAIFPNSG